MGDLFAVWATMEAIPGRLDAARAFLCEAANRLESEPGTTSFRALDLGNGQFAIFNTFRDADAMKAHVDGPVAQWVQESRADFFMAPYAITRAGVFAVMDKGNDG